MDWFHALSELIDTRSFSNIWFWIVLAGLWSVSSLWVLGVPFDLLVRARREGGQAAVDFHDMVRVQVTRKLQMTQEAGPWLAALSFFALTTLFLSGFVYRFEFAQAVFLLALPVTLIWALGLHTAKTIYDRDVVGEALYRILNRHRFVTQIIELLAIFVITMWGMYQNIAANPLGG